MRNEDRLGLQPDVSQPIGATPPAAASSILNFPSPTEFVELPSGGKYYPEGSPLFGVEKVEIKVMTAKEEDILMNENYLKNGVVIDKLLQSVIVDKSIRVDDLLIGDKNAILFATRIAGLGAEYPAKVSCSSCGTTQEHTFDLSTLENKEKKDAEELVTETDNSTFLTTTPRTKLQFELRLLTGEDENNLVQAAKKRAEHKLPQDKLQHQLEMMIVSINGITDRVQIKLCLQSLPALDCRYLRKVYELVSPDLNTNVSFTCNSCSAHQEVSLPMTADFFWSV